MTDKEQQQRIEEIGKAMCEEFRSEHCGNDCECANEFIAKKLVEQGYRKIPKGAVVLTEEEYDSLMKNIAKITKAWSRAMKEAERLHNIKLDLEHQLTQKGLTEYVGADVIKAETRRETAKEIINEIKRKYGKSCSEYYPLLIEITSEELYDLAKQIGVEVDNE